VTSSKTKKSVAVPTAIAAALGAALIAGFGPELWKWFFSTKPPIEYAVKVYSTAASSPPIAQALVRLTLPDREMGPNETDPNGVSLIPLNAKYGDQKATIRAEKAGYESREKQVELPISSASHSIYLTPLSIIAILALASPASSASSASTAASAPLPPPVTPQPGVESGIPRVQSSGPRPSGLGSAYSEWYELCSEPTPQGYIIRNVEFRLDGDRSCGAWAECRESRRTPDTVCYQFRLQGHNEWFPPRPAYTQGILRVVLAKQ